VLVPVSPPRIKLFARPSFDGRLSPCSLACSFISSALPVLSRHRLTVLAGLAPRRVSSLRPRLPVEIVSRFYLTAFPALPRVTVPPTSRLTGPLNAERATHDADGRANRFPVSDRRLRVRR